MSVGELVLVLLVDALYFEARPKKPRECAMLSR